MFFLVLQSPADIGVQVVEPTAYYKLENPCQVALPCNIVQRESTAQGRGRAFRSPPVGQKSKPASRSPSLTLR